MEVASRVLECAALVVLGYNLRATQLFSTTDAESALKLASYVTLPALILHAANTAPPVTFAALAGAPLFLVASAAAGAFSWLFHRGRHARDRALLAGASVGAAAPSVALPLADALLGAPGVLAAAAVAAANAAATCVVSYLLFASAGPAFPERYEHADGGVYRGEWRALSKEGLGVYTYPSGARYEGEWAANARDGRGVYYFPSGGVYEGEWAAGTMAGVGVRTYKDGRADAGRWVGGRLERKLELWQCANAAEGAAEAALAARRVRVGGGALGDGATALAAQPALWASLAGLAVSAAAVPLPGSLAAVAAALAPAHRPLALLATGMLLRLEAPQPRQAADVNTVLASRVALSMLLSANALAAASLLGAPPAATPALLAGALALLSPLPQSAAEYARAFRLNEALAGALMSASSALCLPLLAAVALLAGALGVVGGGAGAGGAAAAAASAVASPATTFAAVLLVASAVIAAAAPLVHERVRTDAKMRLVYAGVGAAAAANDGGGDVAGSSGDAGGESEPPPAAGAGPTAAPAAAIAGRRPRWAASSSAPTTTITLGRLPLARLPRRRAAVVAAPAAASRLFLRCC